LNIADGIASIEPLDRLLKRRADGSIRFLAIAHCRLVLLPYGCANSERRIVFQVRIVSILRVSGVFRGIIAMRLEIESDLNIRNIHTKTVLVQMRTRRSQVAVIEAARFAPVSVRRVCVVTI
jgi:hypothetical protein